MPGFNGTGPVGGGGPGTGRGLGPCAGYRPRLSRFRDGGYGRGIGWGAGRGPGWGACRWWAGAPVYYGPSRVDAEDEKAFLKSQAEELKAELSEMETRISELEKNDD